MATSKTAALPPVPLTPTKIGRLWKKRIARAEGRRRRAMHDASELWVLYTTVYEQRERWGVSIPVARTLVDAMVAESYVQNPDPYVELRQPSATPDAESKTRDLLKSVLDQTKTADIMKRGMVCCSFDGIAGHWADFEQRDHYERRPVVADDGDDYEPDGDPDDATPMKRVLVADEQRCRGQFLRAHEFLVDPDCDNWDLSDAKWIARRYSVTVTEAEDDTSGAYDRGQAKKLRGLVEKQRGIPDFNTGAFSPGYRGDEKDPAYQDVYLWEIWSRVERMIYLVPYGSDFHVGKYAWPKAWAQADMYPLTIIGFREQQPDQRGVGGFYGMPDLRLIRSPLENLPRIEATYLDSATNTIKKFLSVAGALDPKTKAEIQSDKNRQWLDIDLDQLRKKYGNGGPIDLLQLDLRKIIYDLSETDRSVALQQLEAFEHEMSLIYNLLGMGPLERAGVAEGNSATDSLGIQQQMQLHTQTRIEQAAKIADTIAMKFLILLKSSATLPIQYQRGVGINQTVWASFPSEDLWDLDAVVKHAVGSSAPPTREAIKAERKELFVTVAPVLQAMGANQKVFEFLSWMTEPYDSAFAARMLDSGLDDLAMQIVLMINQFQKGQLKTSDRQAVKGFLSAISEFFGRYLSEAQLQMVAQQAVQSIGSNAPAPAQRGTGSLPAAKSGGAAAFARGSAAAGALGGMG